MNIPSGHSDSNIMKGVNARVFLRSFFFESLWNYEKMQNIGFVFCIFPALSRLFPDLIQRDAAVRRNLEPLNTHPSMGPLLAGLTARLEHDLDASTVLAYRKRVMTTLAAHGDHIFWGHIKPLAAIFGVVFTLFFFGSVAGSLAVLVIYNVPNLWTRSQGFRKGWKDWLKVIQVLHSRAVERALVVAKLVMSASLGVGAGLVFLSAIKVGQLGTSELGLWIHCMLLIMAGISGFVMLKKQVPLGAVVYVIPMVLLLAFILLEMRGWFS